MRPSFRALAVVVLAFFTMTTAVAEDSANPAKSSDSNPAVNLAAAPRPADPAQADKTRQPSHFQDDGTPSVETFFGFSYMRFNVNTGQVGPPPPERRNLFGGNGSIAGNVNPWFGLVADFAGYHVKELPLGVHSHFYTFLFGPQFSIRKSDRWTPFVHGLFGVATFHTSLNGVPPAGSFFAQNPHENAFATALGGGVDLKVKKNIAIRLIQADYLLSRFADNNNQQNNVRLSSGIVFRFGGGAPPPPPVPAPTPAPAPANRAPVASCSADKSSVFAESGDSVSVSAKASDPDNDPLTYAWSATGGRVDGSGSTVQWNSAGAAPGNYTVTARVDDGRGGTASCSADIRVDPRPNRPPTISCSAAPAKVNSGDPVRITANASDPDNDPLTYKWSSSGGQIVGSGAQVQLDTKGLGSGHYTVTGQVDDGRGGTADCQSGVDVVNVIETRLSLHSVYFPTAQPTAKDPNGGLIASQRNILIPLAADFKLYLQTKPEAHLILEGHADPRGTPKSNEELSQRRVDRAKSFLVEHGVPAANIETKALGVQQQLEPDQVKQSIDQDAELTPGEKQRILTNMKTIVLASNRRVDISLNTTGQQSVRAFPFNAVDALSLIGGREKPAPAKKTPAKKRPVRRAPKKAAQ